MKPLISHPIISSPIRYHQGPGCREQGSVLVISLLILLIMSLLSITSLNNAVLEEKMAANSRNSLTAFQAAEAALREAENFVGLSMNTNTDVNTNDVVDTNCTKGLCDCDNRDPLIGGTGLSVNGCTAEFWSDSGLNVWETGKYRSYTDNKEVEGYESKYIVEYMGKTYPCAGVPDPRLDASCPDIYRITALGENVNSGARVMLQTTFRK